MTRYLVKHAKVFAADGFQVLDFLVENGTITRMDAHIDCPGATVLLLDGSIVFPGFTDVHVHFREPGFSYKETIATGSRAAARGGYAHVCTMPNLNPCPDSLAHLRCQQQIIDATAAVHVHPFGTITAGQNGERLSDIAALAPHVVGFSDDGRGVQKEAMMRCAMEAVSRCGSIISAHCEDNTLLHGGYIHDGEYARQHGHRGICSESEWRPIERDIRLAEQTHCRYHVCHISCKESVELIRQAKARGVDITCETAPHYLVYCDRQLQEDGRFKMNPPIRSEADREALLEGIRDGTIDMIATDHAPHSAEEKGRGLEHSLMGVTGLETAFAVCYTHLVKTGRITLNRLLELFWGNPRRRFGIGTPLAVGEPADFTAFDLDTQYTVDPAQFISMGRATPFAGETVFGKCMLTMVGGRIVWQENSTEKSC